MEKQLTSKGPMNTTQASQRADYNEEPSPSADETNREPPLQTGTAPGERHSEGSLPENDKETLGTP